MRGKIIATLIAIGAGVYVYGTSAKRDDSGVIVSEGNLDALQVSVGDCFNDTPELTEGEVDEAGNVTATVSSIPVVPCSEPHDNEVYAVFETTATTYESEEGMFNLAMAECQERFASFVGLSYEESSFDIVALYPTPESWQQSDREIVCAVYNLNGEKLTGSVAGTAR